MCDAHSNHRCSYACSLDLFGPQYKKKTVKKKDHEQTTLQIYTHIFRAPVMFENKHKKWDIEIVSVEGDEEKINDSTTIALFDAHICILYIHINIYAASAFAGEYAETTMSAFALIFRHFIILPFEFESLWSCWSRFDLTWLGFTRLDSTRLDSLVFLLFYYLCILQSPISMNAHNFAHFAHTHTHNIFFFSKSYQLQIACIYWLLCCCCCCCLLLFLCSSFF